MKSILLFSLYTQIICWGYLLENYNNKYFLISGENTPLYTAETEFLYKKSDSDTIFSVLLVNNSLSLSLELHYFEFTNSTNIVKILNHDVPLYKDSKNYDLEGVLSIMQKVFKIKGKDVGVYKEYEQIVEIPHKKDKILIKLCENHVFIDGNYYKLYIFSNPVSTTFYLSNFGRKNLATRPKLQLSTFLSFILGTISTITGVYLYHNAKKQFPFIRLDENNS